MSASFDLVGELRLDVNLENVKATEVAKKLTNAIGDVEIKRIGVTEGLDLGKVKAGILEGLEKSKLTIPDDIFILSKSKAGLGKIRSSLETRLSKALRRKPIKAPVEFAGGKVQELTEPFKEQMNETIALVRKLTEEVSGVFMPTEGKKPINVVIGGIDVRLLKAQIQSFFDSGEGKVVISNMSANPTQLKALRSELEQFFLREKPIALPFRLFSQGPISVSGVQGVGGGASEIGAIPEITSFQEGLDLETKKLETLRNQKKTQEEFIKAKEDEVKRSKENLQVLADIKGVSLKPETAKFAKVGLEDPRNIEILKESIKVGTQVEELENARKKLSDLSAQIVETKGKFDELSAAQGVRLPIAESGASLNVLIEATKKSLALVKQRESVKQSELETEQKIIQKQGERERAIVARAKEGARPIQQTISPEISEAELSIEKRSAKIRGLHEELDTLRKTADQTATALKELEEQRIVEPTRSEILTASEQSKPSGARPIGNIDVRAVAESKSLYAALIKDIKTGGELTKEQSDFYQKNLSLTEEQVAQVSKSIAIVKQRIADELFAQKAAKSGLDTAQKFSDTEKFRLTVAKQLEATLSRKDINLEKASNIEGLTTGLEEALRSTKALRKESIEEFKEKREVGKAAPDKAVLDIRKKALEFLSKESATLDSISDEEAKLIGIDKGQLAIAKDQIKLFAERKVLADETLKTNEADATAFLKSQKGQGKVAEVMRKTIARGGITEAAREAGDVGIKRVIADRVGLLREEATESKNKVDTLTKIKKIDDAVLADDEKILANLKKQSPILGDVADKLKSLVVLRRQLEASKTGRAVERGPITAKELEAEKTAVGGDILREAPAFEQAVQQEKQRLVKEEGAEAIRAMFNRSIVKTLGNKVRSLFAFYAVAGFGFRVRAGIQAVIKTAIDFEKEMVNVTKVMNITESGMARMAETIQVLAKNFGFGLTEAAQAAKVFAQQGRSLQQVLELTRASLLLANVSALDTTQATESLTAAMEQFSIPAGSVVRIIDSMNEVANKFAVTERDLTEAIRRAGSAAAETGTDFETFIGLVTAMQARTRLGGKIIGTSLKTAFSRLNADKAVKALESVGIASFDASGEFRDSGERLKDLAAIWGTLSSVQRNNIAQALAARRQYALFVALMNGFKVATSATNTALRSQGSALVENEKIMQTIEKTISQTTATFESFFVKIGEAGLKDVISALTKVLKLFADIGEAIPKELLAILGVGAVGFGIKKAASFGIEQFAISSLFKRSQIGAPISASLAQRAGLSAEAASAIGAAPAPTPATGVAAGLTTGIRQQFGNIKQAMVKNGFLIGGIAGIAFVSGIRDWINEGLTAEQAKQSGITLAATVANTMFAGVAAGGAIGGLKGAAIGGAIGALVGAIRIIPDLFLDTTKEIRLLEESFKKAKEAASDTSSRLVSLEQIMSKARTAENFKQLSTALDKLSASSEVAAKFAPKITEAFITGEDVSGVFEDIRMSAQAKQKSLAKDIGDATIRGLTEAGASRAFTGRMKSLGLKTAAVGSLTPFGPTLAAGGLIAAGIAKIVETFTEVPEIMKLQEQAATISFKKAKERTAAEIQLLASIKEKLSARTRELVASQLQPLLAAQDELATMQDPKRIKEFAKVQAKIAEDRLKEIRAMIIQNKLRGQGTAPLERLSVGMAFAITEFENLADAIARFKIIPSIADSMIQFAARIADVQIAIDRITLEKRLIDPIEKLISTITKTKGFEFSFQQSQEGFQDVIDKFTKVDLSGLADPRATAKIVTRIKALGERGLTGKNIFDLFFSEGDATESALSFSSKWKDVLSKSGDDLSKALGTDVGRAISVLSRLVAKNMGDAFGDDITKRVSVESKRGAQERAKTVADAEKFLSFLSSAFGITLPKAAGEDAINAAKTIFNATNEIGNDAKKTAEFLEEISERSKKPIEFFEKGASLLQSSVDTILQAQNRLIQGYDQLSSSIDVIASESKARASDIEKLEAIRVGGIDTLSRTGRLLFHEKRIGRIQQNRQRTLIENNKRLELFDKKRSQRLEGLEGLLAGEPVQKRTLELNLLNTKLLQDEAKLKIDLSKKSIAFLEEEASAIKDRANILKQTSKEREAARESLFTAKPVDVFKQVVAARSAFAALGPVTRGPEGQVTFAPGARERLERAIPFAIRQAMIEGLKRIQILGTQPQREEAEAALKVLRKAPEDDPLVKRLKAENDRAEQIRKTILAERTKATSDYINATNNYETSVNNFGTSVDKMVEKLPALITTIKVVHEKLLEKLFPKKEEVTGFAAIAEMFERVGSSFTNLFSIEKAIEAERFRRRLPEEKVAFRERALEAVLEDFSKDTRSTWEQFTDWSNRFFGLSQEFRKTPERQVALVEATDNLTNRLETFIDKLGTTPEVKFKIFTDKGIIEEIRLALKDEFADDEEFKAIAKLIKEFVIREQKENV